MCLVIGLDYWEVWQGGTIVSEYGSPTANLWTVELLADGQGREYRVRGVAQGGDAGRHLNIGQPNSHFIPAGETQYTSYSEPYICSVPDATAPEEFEMAGDGRHVPGEPAPIAVELYKSLRGLLAMDDGSDPGAGDIYMFWLVLTLIAAGLLGYGGYRGSGKNLQVAAIMFGVVFVPMWSIGGPTLAGVDWRAALPLTGVVIPIVAGMLFWRRGLRM